jgi:hypothetical protein
MSNAQPEASLSFEPKPDASMDTSASSSQQSTSLPSLPPQPIPEPSEDYGRRFTALLEALELTVRKGTNKFSFVPPFSLPSFTADVRSNLANVMMARYEDFQLAFPLQCMLNPKECREVWLQVGEELRTRVLVRASCRVAASPIRLLCRRTSLLNLVETDLICCVY